MSGAATGNSTATADSGPDPHGSMGQSKSSVWSAASPSYLNFARQPPCSGWLYLAGLITILIVWIIGTVIILIPVLLVTLNFTSPDSLVLDLGSSWLNNLVTLATFIPLLVATPLVVRWYHGRPWKTVITPFRKMNWKLIAVGAGIWTGLLTLLTLAGVVIGIDELRWSFEPFEWIPNVAVLLGLLFFQTSAEELLFRGYLPQWISLLTRSRIIQSLTIGVVFALPHLANPEMVNLRGWEWVAGAATYFLMGFMLTWVSISSGTIELALGAHFGNNLLVMAVFAPSSPTDSSLGTAGLFAAVGEPSILLGFIETLIAVAIFILATTPFKGSGELVVLPVKSAPALELTPAPVQQPWTRPSGPHGPWITSTPPFLSPPGWYPDPWRRGSYRYWDGRGWTAYIVGGSGL